MGNLRTQYNNILNGNIKNINIYALKSDIRNKKNISLAIKQKMTDNIRLITTEVNKAIKLIKTLPSLGLNQDKNKKRSILMYVAVINNLEQSEEILGSFFIKE